MTRDADVSFLAGLPCLHTVIGAAFDILMIAHKSSKWTGYSACTYAHDRNVEPGDSIEYSPFGHMQALMIDYIVCTCTEH